MKTQKTILFIMASATGHINATFPLAHRLQQVGYQIIYGVEQVVETIVERQGYGVVKMPTMLFNIEVSPENNWIERIFESLINNLNGRTKAFISDKVVIMNKVILDISPDLIILDSFISYNYWLIQSKVPIVMVQTTFATNKKKNIPPLTSMLYPGGNLLNKLRIYWAWNSVFIKNILLLPSTFSFTPSSWKTVKKLSNFKKHEIQSTAILHPLFSPSVGGRLELVLAPESFDWTSKDNPVQQFYVGCQGNWRKEENIEEDRIWSQILEKIKKESDKTWVYCSLGTLNMIHNPRSAGLLQKISNAFAFLKDWRLILTTGMVDPLSIKNAPDNVYVFQKAPQLSLLNHCKIMINHGGTNSVFEAIRVAIPMLVYPLGWDQPGIGARVAYHGLGIVGNIKRETTQGIRKKLEALIADEKIIINCKEWQRKIKSDDRLDEVPELLGKLMPV